jgi:hypothetical protein
MTTLFKKSILFAMLMLTIVLSSNAQVPSEPKTTNTPTEQTETKEKKEKKDRKGDKMHKGHKDHDDDRDENREGKKDKKDRKDDNEKGEKEHKDGHKHGDKQVGKSGDKENGESDRTVYACPMKCEKPSKTAGKCSKCGMDLVAMTKKEGRGKRKGDR